MSDEQSRLTGQETPLIRTEVPGPSSRALVDVLARHECPAITARRSRRAATIGAADDDPLVWSDARGAVVRDADGNRYVDLTSGFGVAFVGHRHPRVTDALHAQTDRLLHAMGDAWPDEARIRLLAELARHAPGDLEVALLGLSGSDAVEGARKTAWLATGRSTTLTFSGAYHGLSLGALPLQRYKAAFIESFAPLVSGDTVSLPWGADPAEVARVVEAHQVGLVLVEPIQGRGGVIEPPPGWLAAIAKAARDNGALFGLDEIYTGFGRAGAWFTGPVEGVVPDVLCVGKALAGGLPLSAVLGSREVMDRWGASTGEALHTQTFLGHPLACAAALAVLHLLDEEGLPALAHQKGKALIERLTERGYTVRGRGLMLGVALDDTLAVARRLQRRGFLSLPAGPGAEVLALSPPVCITDAQTDAFLDALDEVS